MQNLRTLYAEALQQCHSERSEESHAETLRCTQGDNSGVLILCRLAYSGFHLSEETYRFLRRRPG